MIQLLRFVITCIKTKTNKMSHTVEKYSIELEQPNKHTIVVRVINNETHKSYFGKISDSWNLMEPRFKAALACFARDDVALRVRPDAQSILFMTPDPFISNITIKLEEVDMTHTLLEMMQKQAREIAELKQMIADLCAIHKK